jgi:Domain of unknown function (DUF4397)
MIPRVRPEPHWAIRILVVITAAALLPLIVAGQADAQPAAGSEAQLRVGNLSPDTPPLDVTVFPPSGPVQFVVDSLGYGTVSPYSSSPPGEWRVEFRPVGFGSDTPPELAGTVRVEPGRSYTVVAAGRQNGLMLQIMDDSGGITNPAAARIRVFNSTLRDEINIAAPWVSPPNSAVVAGTAGGYLDVPAGTPEGTVSAPDVAPVGLAGPLTAGCAYTAIVQERNDVLSTSIVQDACGLVATPAGAVPAGLGWKSGTREARAALALMALLTGAGLLACAYTLQQRTRSRAPVHAPQRSRG